MKAPRFAYTRVLEVSDALAVLATGGGTAKAMGGSQSFGPMLNLRLARPAHVSISLTSPVCAPSVVRRVGLRSALPSRTLR